MHEKTSRITNSIFLFMHLLSQVHGHHGGGGGGGGDTPDLYSYNSYQAIEGEFHSKFTPYFSSAFLKVLNKLWKTKTKLGQKLLCIKCYGSFRKRFKIPN